MSKYGDFSGPYFLVFGLNTEIYCVNVSVFSPNAGKYGPEKTPYLDTFRKVIAKSWNKVSSLTKETPQKKPQKVAEGSSSS